MATIQVDVILKGVDVEVDVDFEPGWSRPGNRRGHPDNWDDGDGEPAEVEKITLHLRSGRYVDVEKWLAPSQIEKIQEACDRYEHDSRDDYPDEPDNYDDPRGYNVDAGTDNYGRDREYFRYH